MSQMSPLLWERTELNLIPLLLRRLWLQALSSSSLDQSSMVSSHVDKKKKKGKGKKKKDKKEKKKQPSALDGARSKRTLEKPSSLLSFARGTTFLRSVLVSLVYKKSGLKGPNHLCHQPLTIMLMILPQPMTIMFMILPQPVTH